jgi:hypothetical protein
MNYVEEIRTQLAARLPKLDPALLDLYTLLGIEFGTTTDAVMVHNAWAIWQNRTQPDHRSLIPFPYLAPEVQELDVPYVDAIREAVCAAAEAAAAAARPDRDRAGSDSTAGGA